MQQRVFSRESRFLLCPRCGAPIEGAIEGGTVACHYCGASSMLPARDESHEARITAAPPAISEAERFQKLREQGHRPLVPPPSLAHLVVDLWLPPANVPAALAEFQRARHEVAAGGSFGAAERLYFLTLMLYEHLVHERKDAQVRALLETARDVLSEPLHRQMIHGMLARNAARVGDRVAAEGWLHLMTPHATDLQMDTAYRFTRAYLSTREGDVATVLRVLGTRLDDVPISETYVEVCAVFRANALERSGEESTAVAQLAHVAAARADGATRLASLVKASPELALCPRSLPALLARPRW